MNGIAYTNPIDDDALRILMVGACVQDAAADKAGVSSGEAWRVVLSAATSVGAQQVILGDRPADISQRRLAREMLSAASGRVAAALGLIVAGGVAAAMNVLQQVRREGVNDDVRVWEDLRQCDTEANSKAVDEVLCVHWA